MTRQSLAWCLLSAIAGWTLAASPAEAQAPACRQALATLSVPAGSYQQVPVQAFEGRVFVYVPEVSSRGSGFQPFQVWVVEGVYGRPFLRPSGSLTAGAFTKLRASPNVRALAIRVARGDGSEASTLRMGRDAYSVQVTGVTSRGKTSVQVRVCR